MNKFLLLHDYSENMKAKLATFCLKGKAKIWWEDMNNVIGIQEYELTWREFDILFKKKYLSDRYYDNKEKELYGLKMGSTNDEDYTKILLEFLRYVPYLKEKAKIERFISGLSVAFKEMIKFDEPRSLEESIKNLNY